MATQTFHSEAIDLIVLEKENCLVEFDAKASPELVKRAKKEALKTVAKEVSIPGFRKGKAPEEILLKRFKKTIEDKWHKILADETFKECEKLAKIPLLNGNAQVTFKLKGSLSEEEGTEMHFSFEQEPKVPDISFEDIKLEPADRPVIDEEKVQESIKKILMFFATWKKITDRPVQEGDYILIDVDIIDEEPIKRLFSDTRFEVSDKGMAQWMKNLVLGHSIGESIEGMSEPDEDATEKDKESLRPRKVKITIKSIEEAKLPELDDAFVQKIGAQDVEDFKQKLNKLLNKQADEASRQGKRDQISDALLKKYTFDLPKSILEKEVAFRFRQFLQDPAFQARYRSMSDEEIKEIKEKLKNQADQAIRLFYISRKIVAEADIPISTKELEAKGASLLEMMFDRSRPANFKELSEEQKALALSRLMLNKAHDYIIEKIENT